MAKEKAVEEGPNKSDAVREILKNDPKMPSKKVVEALAAKGITVSLPLVNKIKYAKADGAPKASSGAGRRGRPSGGVNVSEEIRKYIEANKEATRPQIRDAMVAAGHTVSVSLVNAVFNRVHAGGSAPAARRGRPPKNAGAASSAPATAPARRGRPPKAAAPAAAPVARPAAAVVASTGGSLSAADLVSAKQLVDSFGGADRVRQALALLEQLR